jgi:hypothetical protein
VFRSRCHLLASEISAYRPTIGESAKVAPPILADPFPNLYCTGFSPKPEASQSPKGEVSAYRRSSILAGASFKRRGNQCRQSVPLCFLITSRARAKCLKTEQTQLLELLPRFARSLMAQNGSARG